jgi:hypothetical protein
VYSLGSPILASRLPNNRLLVIIVIFHIRDLIIILLLPQISRFINRPHIPDTSLLLILIGNSIAAPSGAQPAILPVRGTFTAVTARQVISHNLILQPRIAGEVIVQPSVAGHAAGYEKLLAGWKVGDSLCWT